MKKILCLIAMIIVLSDGFTVFAAGRIQPTSDTVVIVIDPGHGGENEGTSENGFWEKSMTLTTAFAMYEELCKYDNVEVYLTRTEDIDISLKERAEFAVGVGADFLFSIHYNASVDHNWFGAEVWIPSDPPYNAYGYQFGYTQMLAMEEAGLFLRGVKTKKNDRGMDYYGIIREAAKLDLPAVIIEHCHVDEERDSSFCDTEEELIAFGKADATSVAKYFGLTSEVLGVDYSAYSAENLPAAESMSPVASTMWDETPPEVCVIEAMDSPNEEHIVKLQVMAADYDSPLIYFDYSVDGGATFTPLKPWPRCDVLKGTFTDSFQLAIELPVGEAATVILRAYNQFDTFTQSNTLLFPAIAHPIEKQQVPDSNVVETLGSEDAVGNEQSLRKNIFKIPESVSRPSGEVSVLVFLKLSLLMAVLLFGILLFSKFINHCLRKRRRHHRRKDSG